MTIAQSLERLSLLNSDINKKLDDLERLRQRSISIGGFDYAQDRVQTSPSNDASYTRIVDLIVEREVEIDKLIDKYVDLRKVIDSHIYAILPQDEYEIVNMRWYKKMGWHKIANALDYSESTVHRKYNCALNTIRTQDIELNI